MRASDPRSARAIVAAWLAATFVLSAVTDWRILAAVLALSLAAFHAGAGAHLRTVLRLALPLSAGASAAGWAFERLAGRDGPAIAPVLALNLRTALLAFLALAVLARVDLLAAIARWPSATRLAAIALAQIHALRLLATESRLGIRSRLPRRPRTGEAIRGAATITGTLLVLSGRNARDVADALRARGA
jgi:cobalt/nickel transport system permease protein